MRQLKPDHLLLNSAQCHNEQDQDPETTLDFTIQRLKKGNDLSEIAKLVRAFIFDDLKGLEALSALRLEPESFVTDTMSHIDRYLPPDGCLLAANDRSGEHKGCVFLRTLSPDVGEIKRLYVHPDLRGTGAGSKLMHQIADEARQLGLRTLVLDVGKYATAAQALYRKLGYREISVYPGGETDPAITPHLTFMQLDLAP
ncbi:N-acyltransferase YncA [Roseovarius albus]|uniref:N-acyltransferase YncA n=1 Tax=Roseovarius albus TaxID=1247867 RepID=A0A1X6ZET8_9RHOB|nr:GNAT family N-acetyltransferase [Roseovarius albus]SLN49288.1 N-acyltransferase YncA [Roseovarius albus]